MAKGNTEVHVCRECVNCTEVTEPEKLSVKGEPILGRCPFWTESKSVLLSQIACKENFEAKENNNITV